MVVVSIIYTGIHIKMFVVAFFKQCQQHHDLLLQDWFCMVNQADLLRPTPTMNMWINSPLNSSNQTLRVLLLEFLLSLTAHLTNSPLAAFFSPYLPQFYPLTLPLLDIVPRPPCSFYLVKDSEGYRAMWLPAAEQEVREGDIKLMLSGS